MRRGFHEMIAEVLFEAKARRAAKSRVAARCSVNNNFINDLIDMGLLAENTDNTAIVTEKGTEFLIHFQALQKLSPKPQRVIKEPEIPFKMG